MDVQFCASCDKPNRLYPSMCPKNHTTYICTYCKQSRRCSKCPSSTIKYCNVCQHNPGSTPQPCGKHTICDRCFQRQTNTNCNYCGVSACDVCSTNKTVEYLHCRMHRACKDCYMRGITCLKCLRKWENEGSNCSSCGKTMMKGFNVFECEHEVCLECAVGVCEADGRCGGCRKGLDKGKAEVLRKMYPDKIKKCFNCNRSPCVCDSPRRNGQARTELQIRPQKESENILCCTICKTIVQSQLLDSLCKFCSYNYQV